MYGKDIATSLQALPGIVPTRLANIIARQDHAAQRDYQRYVFNR